LWKRLSTAPGLNDLLGAWKRVMLSLAPEAPLVVPFWDGMAEGMFGGIVV